MNPVLPLWWLIDEGWKLWLDESEPGGFDLPFMVEQWDDANSHVEELIALTGDYRVARAAYEEAVKRRPGRIVTLRQKTRLLADSRSLK